MNDKPRLIEVAFPLKQASLDSVHEKNVRHGHISTLHIWPARRPLAACRAALIATLLPDPGNAEERQKILEKLAGHVVPTVKKKKMPSGKIEQIKAEETVGGILHWGRENGPDLEWFRQEIRKAYGGRAPKVLDPFAGGGAIPLEAMRLGCEATAIDINPVAWFILKCTLEYPQKLAGKKLPLPEFILDDREFMEKFCKANKLPLPTKGRKDEPANHANHANEEGKLEQFELHEISREFASFAGNYEADLAWHVRAWGKWVLKHARKELAEFYPTYASWEPLLPQKAKKVEYKWLAQWKKDHAAEIESKGLRLCPLTPDGEVDVEKLNEEFSAHYLAKPANPRWVPKPTVAYLWARTVKNKHYPETTIPLLKTRWLCKKDNKRVLLTMEVGPEQEPAKHAKHANDNGLPDETDNSRPFASFAGQLGRIKFGIQNDVPKVGGNTAQRREHDRRIGAGTMSRSGVTCPVHGNIMTMEDIRLEGQAARLSARMTAVVVDGPLGKEYRLPTELEAQKEKEAEKRIEAVFTEVPFGIPDEATPKAGIGASRAFSVDGYGFDRWEKIFLRCQLFAVGIFVLRVRRAALELKGLYDANWAEAIVAGLGITIDKLVDRSCSLCRWDQGYTKVNSTFTRFALPILWDFCEGNPLSDTTGNYLSAVEWVAMVFEENAKASLRQPAPDVHRLSAIRSDQAGDFDVIVTDPPYYDAIPYSDLMDFFYIWLRRSLRGLMPQFDEVFRESLSPKWSHVEKDGELIDDASRFGGSKELSKRNYEEGMARVFGACSAALRPDGQFVIVFAHKHPDGWETLVSAIIKAGFVVDGSWPIQTEMGNRSRAHGSAALSSSVWLVCKKRHPAARPGWDNIVLQQMRERITIRLRDFWDAGIRGPDFVWAATGPALEAYSKHPVVKKANKPNELMSVSEFLRHVRRMVLDFVVIRVLEMARESREERARESREERARESREERARESRESREKGQKQDDSSEISRPFASLAGNELDDVTTYYLLHRNDFKMDDAPAGACILYAVSCNLSDRDLVDAFDLLAPAGKAEARSLNDEDETEDAEDDEDATGSGSAFKLKPWNKRKRPGMGYDPVVRNPRTTRNTPIMEEKESDSRQFASLAGTPGVGVIPLIDQIHRLMHLWKAGDVVKVDDYLNSRSLRTNALFPPVLQAVIEMADGGSEERAILESLSNHVQGRSARAEYMPDLPANDGARE